MGAPSDKASGQTAGPPALTRDITFDDEIAGVARPSISRPSRRISRTVSVPARGKSADSELSQATGPEPWTPELQDRLLKAKADLWEAQKAWSTDQEIFLKEVEELEAVKKAFEKFNKRRSKKHKRDGSRFKVSTSASTSQNVSDVSDDENDDSDIPPPQRSITNLLRRMSLNTRGSEKDSDAVSIGSNDDSNPPTQRPRSHTVSETPDSSRRGSMIWSSALFSRRLSRRGSRSVVESSEDTTDVETGSSDSRGMTSWVLRRVSSARAPGEVEVSKQKGFMRVLRRQSKKEPRNRDQK